eukprot:scaffold27967_cov90-Isochrysis_galbana.AAC.2
MAEAARRPVHDGEAEGRQARRGVCCVHLGIGGEQRLQNIQMVKGDRLGKRRAAVYRVMPTD